MYVTRLLVGITRQSYAWKEISFNTNYRMRRQRFFLFLHVGEQKNTFPIIQNMCVLPTDRNLSTILLFYNVYSRFEMVCLAVSLSARKRQDPRRWRARMWWMTMTTTTRGEYTLHKSSVEVTGLRYDSRDCCCCTVWSPAVDGVSLSSADAATTTTAAFSSAATASTSSTRRLPTTYDERLYTLYYYYYYYYYTLSNRNNSNNNKIGIGTTQLLLVMTPQLSLCRPVCYCCNVIIIILRRIAICETTDDSNIRELYNNIYLVALLIAGK